MHGVLLKLWGWLPIPHWLRWRIMWMLMPKFLVGASALIFDETGKILVFHHTYRTTYPWGLPGGFLNHNEDGFQAIVRELQEEAGLTIEVEQLLWSGTSRHYPRIDMFYLCRHIQGDFRPSAEVSDARFVEFEALEEIMEPEHYEMIRHTLSQFSGR